MEASPPGQGPALDPEALAKGVLEGKRRALAQAITLIESTRGDHRAAASELLQRLTPHAGKSIRLGISGVPGVGKSTFVETLGNQVIDAGHRVAVLSVDPSSAISGGSILGDKTRMETLSRRREAYIRPSPAGNTLGGVTRRSREAMILCEAAGFDVIMVETVGVGQSETKVAEMTDMFVLLLHPRLADWKVQVRTCSARDGVGIAEAWEVVLKHRSTLESSGEFGARRAAQARAWMWSEVNDSLITALQSDPEVRKRIPDLEAAASAGRIPPTIAARQLLEIFLKRHKQWD